MKTWAWILVGGGAFTMLAGYMASRAQASGSTGGFSVPPGTQLSASERALLASIPTDPATPGHVHHDIQEALDLYLANRQADGSATIDGTRYANLAAVLAAAAQG